MGWLEKFLHNLLLIQRTTYYKKMATICPNPALKSEVSRHLSLTEENPGKPS